MRSDLLDALFASGSGCVLHKGYPIERLDDGTAVTLLRMYLPSGVTFRTLPGAPPDTLTPEEIAANLRDDNWLMTADAPAYVKYQAWKTALESLAKPGYSAWIREQYRLPGHGSTLFVGTPESFLGYVNGKATEDNDPTTDLRKLLDGCGYPNRYAYQGPRRILDRKIWKPYDVEYFNTGEAHGIPRQEYGLIYLGRTPTGRCVLVVAGCNETGTLAGVQLLFEEHPDIREAVRSFAEGRTPCIDVGYRCTPAERTLLPFVHVPKELPTEILNPSDVAGFQFGHVADREFAKVFAWLQSPKRAKKEVASVGGDAFTWDCTDETGQIRIRITAKKPIRVSDDRLIFPCGDTWDLYEAVEKDLRTDGHDWRDACSRLAKWLERGNEPLPSDLQNLPRGHVLILGESGTGKQLLTNFIARAWGGRQLLGEYRNENGLITPTEYGNFNKDLLEAIRHWPEGGPQIYSINTPGIPEQLASEQYFGSVYGAFTGCAGTIAAFHRAGTGLLFCDEFLEMSPTLQAQLLTALSSGKFRPMAQPLEMTFACKVLGATNKARNEAELKQLIQQGAVRRDLIARFRHTYTLEPLTNRPSEIVPAMIAALARFGTGGGTTDDVRAVRLRLTRSALQAILTRDYPENLRTLDKLVDHLDRDVARAFARGGPTDGQVLRLNDLVLPGVRRGDRPSNDLDEGPTIEVLLDWDGEPLDPANAISNRDHRDPREAVWEALGQPELRTAYDELLEKAADWPAQRDRTIELGRQLVTGIVGWITGKADHGGWQTRLNAAAKILKTRLTTRTETAFTRRWKSLSQSDQQAWLSEAVPEAVVNEADKRPQKKANAHKRLQEFLLHLLLGHPPG